MTTALTADAVIPPLRRDIRVIAWVVAASLSRVGDVAWFIGLAWTAAHVAGPAGAGLVMGVGSVPRAAILLIGGAYADRLDARRTMVIANFARIAVLAVAIVVVDARARCRGGWCAPTTWRACRRCSSSAAGSPPWSARRSAASWSRPVGSRW